MMGSDFACKQIAECGFACSYEFHGLPLAYMADMESSRRFRHCSQMPSHSLRFRLAMCHYNKIKLSRLFKSFFCHVGIHKRLPVIGEKICKLFHGTEIYRFFSFQTFGNCRNLKNIAQSDFFMPLHYCPEYFRIVAYGRCVGHCAQRSISTLYSRRFSCFHCLFALASGVSHMKVHVRECRHEAKPPSVNQFCAFFFGFKCFGRFARINHLLDFSVFYQNGPHAIDARINQSDVLYKNCHPPTYAFTGVSQYSQVYILLSGSTRVNSMSGIFSIVETHLGFLHFNMPLIFSGSLSLIFSVIFPFSTILTVRFGSKSPSIVMSRSISFSILIRSFFPIFTEGMFFMRTTV